MTNGLSVAVAHRQGDFALDVAFEAPAGVTALFGRSGSGKTTLVKLVAGLLRPDRGRITLDGRVLFDSASRVIVPSHRRRVGLVFQEGRLFPHLTVRQNLGFGRWFAPRDEPGADMAAVIDLLGLAPLLARHPAGLSGGESQRVAIGRALLAKPRLLLMDEPLSALDTARKAEILPYIERLRDEAGIPILYVSHAVGEVARLADTLIVIEGGRVQAMGPAGAILARLDIGPLRASDEAGSALAGHVAQHDDHYGLTKIDTPAGVLSVPRLALAEGAALRVRILARDVMVCLDPPTRTSALNILAGTVRDMVARDAATVDLALACGDAVLTARITRRSAEELGLAPGRAIHAVIKSVALDPSAAARRQG